MGQEHSEKKEFSQDDIYNAIFKMKMASKKLIRASRKEEKSIKKNKVKAKKALLRGDQESARLYASNAMQNEATRKQYLSLGIKMDAMADRIKSNKESTSIMKYIAKDVTPTLVGHIDNFDLAAISKNLDTFQTAFDNMTVNTNIVNQNFTNITSDQQNTQKADDLLNQLKNEVQHEMNAEQDLEQDLDVELQKNKNKSKQNEDKAIDDFIAELKN